MRMNQQELEAAEILIELAIREDIGPGDITTNNLIPSGIRKRAEMTAKADGVIAGLEVAEMVFLQFGDCLSWTPLIADGDPVKKGDVIYIFSDGYIDQFGGENGEKLKAARFKQVLLEIHQYPLKEQKKMLSSFFEKWKGTKFPQIDDILIFGVKV